MQQSGAVLGERVRRLRLQAGRGLREQARAIGISASSLSALENDRGGVSLQRLQRVADHFGVALTELLRAESGETPRAREVELVRAGEAGPAVERGVGTAYQLIGGGGVLQPYLLTFDPGGGYGDDMLGHPGEEFAYVVFGSVELLLGDEQIPLAQGDCVRFRTETPHAFRNASSTGVAVVTGAATPPW